MAMAFTMTAYSFAAPNETTPVISDAEEIMVSLPDTENEVAEAEEPIAEDAAEVNSVQDASNYATSAEWNLYYFIGSSQTSQSIRLVYSGNNYSAKATSFGGDNTDVTTTVSSSGATLATFRRLTGLETKQLHPVNPGTPYIDFRVAFDFNGGSSATSKGTIRVL